MAPSQRPPEKKQRSLMTFFAPRPAANGAARSAAAASQKPAPIDAEDSRKRPLEEDPDKGNNRPEKATKRAKGDDVVVDDEPSGLFNATAASTTAPVAVSSPSSRTERFLYGPSSSQSRPPADEDEPDPEVARRRAELHKKFVRKLGHPDSMLRRRTNAPGRDDGGEDDEGEGEDADEDDPAPPKSRAAKGGAKANKKLTPMEIQFLDIKRKHMDTVLIVEVGYKFRFFGEDARIAAKELSIVCIPGKFRYDEHPSEAHLDRFASASIPVHRLPVHAKRLVAAGHKVGVVRQIETAALKKAGDNRNAPFVRKLTNVYTKGTYIDENGELDAQGDGGSPAGGYLLCITETPAKGLGADEKVDVGVLAVQPATGDIIYDSFEDGFMRSEIETRLLHISPCEFLIVGDLTKGTEKLVQHLSGSSTNVFGDRSRVERVPRPKTMAAEAYSHVTKFYAGKLKDAAGDDRTASLLDKVLHLPEQVTVCLSAMITHLTEYGLEHIFDLTKYFQSFTTRSHMLVNGTTLESLEVYRNATDHAERGSLFWALDKTTTKFGRRLLRKWVGRPLLDKDRLEERVAAVEELLEAQSTAKVDKLEKLLGGVRADLERSLIRIYYGKCTRPELLASLQTLQKTAMQYSTVKSAADTGFDSHLVADAIASLPQILDVVVPHLDKINPEAARKDDKYGFFREDAETEDIQDQRLGIAAVEQELDEYRDVAAQKLGKKKPVEYATVAGIEYLIEVSNSDLKHVPASWAKISGTKKLSRFHTPEASRLMSERDQHREALAAACDAAFASLLADVAAAYQPLRDAVSALATLDCLLSLARVAALPGYSKPAFLPADHPPTIAIVNGRHPVAEHTLPSGYIPFSTSLASPAPLAHLITGPNMGGKSSFVRAVALLVLLAQVGSFVPADSLSLTLADAIYTRMGARDNLFRGESTFMVEVSETAAILRAATPRSLVVLDELGRGTSTHDGAAIAHAVLEYVARETRCLTLFITHYQDLARVADGIEGGAVRNVHMRFTAAKRGQREGGRRSSEDGVDVDGGADGDEADDEDEITFLYEVGEGVAHRSYGLNVARLARIPRKVRELAALKSRQLEDETRMRRLRGAVDLLADVLCDGPDQLEHLISGIEQL